MMNWDWEILKPQSLDQLLMSIAIVLVAGFLWYKGLVLNKQYGTILENGLIHCDTICNQKGLTMTSVNTTNSQIVCGCNNVEYWMINQSIVNENANFSDIINLPGFN